MLEMFAENPDQRPPTLTVGRKRLADDIAEPMEPGVAGSTHTPPASSDSANPGQPLPPQVQETQGVHTLAADGVKPRPGGIAAGLYL